MNFAMIKCTFMRKLSFVVILLICSLIINNLVRSIYGLWQKSSLIEQAKQDLLIEKRKNIALRLEMEEVGSPMFVEQEARNRLFLTKPGEEVILVPKELDEEIKTTKKMRSKSNWQQWLIYFGFSS